MLILLLVSALLCACAGAEEDPAPVPSEPVPTAPLLLEDISAEAELMAPEPVPAFSFVLEPEASGELELRCDDVVVDYSNASEGYIMLRYLSPTESRIKVLLSGPETTYNYNLPVDEWTVFPLSDGSGRYEAAVYENTGGTKYALVMKAEFEAQLQDEFAPFLRPNQYVNYAAATQAVGLAAELCAGLSQPLDKLALIYDYVVSNLSYDYEKAATVKSGYLPVLDEVLEEKKGICFDYAALMAAMLRSQQIPCKLVVGYAGSTYHAWISVWTEENGWVDGAIFFDGHSWKRMDPTFASSAERSEEIMNFIENGQYSAKYLY